MKKNIGIYILIICAIELSCWLSRDLDIDHVPDGSQVVIMDKSKIELDDGDSFEYDGMGIRILGIDTPEISHPEHGFFEDQPYGREASALTAELIEGAGNLAYVPFEEDRYGRMLAHVFIDGNLLGIKLIKAGLAYETVSYYGDSGFPELAQRILTAAADSKTKDFIPPHEWRRFNRRAPAEDKKQE